MANPWVVGFAYYWVVAGLFTYARAAGPRPKPIDMVLSFVVGGFLVPVAIAHRVFR